MAVLSRKIPIPARSFIAALLCASLPLSASAAALSDEEVIRLARAGDPEAAAAREAVAVAAAREIEAGLYPNPVLAWDREDFPGSSSDAESEDAFFLTVPLEISGRRPARRALARAETAGAQVVAARAQSEVIGRALRTFYDALAGQRRAEILRRSLQRLDEAARVIARREEEGTVSGYERHRLELEAELAGGDLRAAEARAQALRRELALVLALDPNELELQADHLQTPAAEAAAAAPAMARPSLELARAAAAEAGVARQSAAWAWLPALSLSGGMRTGVGDETRYGYVAGVAVALPVFSHGQELRAEAAAQERLATARARAAERAARLEAMRAAAALALARRELARFEETIPGRVERLERAAESGYREGQRSIIELLDAQRARASVELRRLALNLAARRAEVELRAARGELE